jgi:YD repeat-containing protein
LDIDIDQNGNLIIDMAFGSDGLPEARASSIYKYDSNNNPIETTTGSGRQTISYVCNQAGKVIESRVMDAKGGLTARNVFSWNANGMLDEVNSFNADGFSQNYQNSQSSTFRRPSCERAF